MSDFYTNIAVSGKFILFRGVESGKRIRRKVEYQPTFYVPSKEQSEFTTISGDYVKPIKPGNIADCREFLEKYEGVDNFPIYGNNRYEYAYIADEYPEDILWDINKVTIANLDIEVGSENGFPEPREAKEPITAITIKIKGNYFVFGTNEYTKHREDVHYAHCLDEIELINRFMQLWTRFYPDVVTGWGVDHFDIPYIVNRITNLLGEEEARKLSPWNKLSQREAHFKNKKVQMYKISGIAALDYMKLYQKFTYTQQEEWNLNHISHVELGERKLDYSEYENLHQLYKRDFQKFIEYNIRDVELVEKLENKMKLLEQALTLAYDNRVNYEDVFTQVRMWDSIVYNHMKKRNLVMPPMKRGDKKEAYEGAYVKEPLVGMHKWVCSFDLNSLYPHLIMQYNISMETLIEPRDYTPTMRALASNHLVNVDSLLSCSVDTSALKECGATMTPNCQFFKTDKQGLLAEIMDSMYKDRTRYKKLALEAKKKIEEVKDDKNQIEYLKNQVSRYNNLQTAKKVTLNSAYGALGNEFFRFFDIRMATAITSSGQLSIRWIENKINEYMNQILKTKNKDYVIASDTDSIYLNMGPLIEKLYPDTSDTKKVIKFMDKVCIEKIQPFIDKSYIELKEYLNAYQQRMEMKRESLADKAIWTSKKHYILNVHNNEGIEYSKPVLKILGLEAVKSSTPGVCREKIKEAIRIVMNESEERLQEFVEQFRTEFRALPVEKIAFPRGVNGLAEYSDAAQIFKKGTPIHVKGALVYNHFLKSLNLTKRYQLIKEGEKIKYVYLKQPNIFKNNTIAFLSVLPKQLNAEQYIDYDTQFSKTFLDPLDTILSVINWKAEPISTLEDFFS